LNKSPIILIASNEFYLCWRKKSTKFLFYIYIFIQLFALYLSWQNQQNQSTEQQHFQQIVEQQWHDQPNRHPHRAAHYGQFVFRPIQRESLYEPGINRYAGNMIYLEAHRQNSSNFSDASLFSSTLLLGELSLATIHQQFLPLCLILIGFQLFGYDREQKRHLWLLSQGITPTTYFLGKALGLLKTATPFLLLTLASFLPLLYLGITDEVIFSLIFPTALHCLFWLILIHLISFYSKHSLSSIIILTFFWLITTLIIPKSIHHFANHFHPLPTKLKWNQQLDEILFSLGDSHNPNDPKYQQWIKDLLTQHNVTNEKDLPFNLRGKMLEEGEKKSAQAFQQLWLTLKNQYNQQLQWSRYLSWLCPPLQLKNIHMNLCQTTLPDYIYYLEKVEEHRYQSIQKLNLLQQQHISYQGNTTERLDSKHWHLFPKFTLLPQPLNIRIQSSLIFLLQLSLFTLTMLLIFYFSAKKNHVPIS
jgi:ABC-2 type transport system permease protein